MISRTIRRFFAHPLRLVPIFLSSLTSSILLPLSSSSILQVGEERMNKYDALRDEVAYLEMGYAEFSSLREELGEGNAAAYLPFVQEFDGMPTLFVVSDFLSPSFGFPYLEDAYVGLSGRNFEGGRFYANFETSLPSFRFEGEKFLYGGDFSCVLPFLDPLEERHPIERIALLVAPSRFLEGKGVLQCAFDPANAEGTIHFPSRSFGAAKKEAYRAECSSFLRYVDAMGWLPLLGGSAILLFLGAFAYSSFREERRTMKFYARSRLFLFLEETKLYGTLFLLPSALGILADFAIVSALGYPFSWAMVISVLCISALFAVVFPLCGVWRKEKKQ